MSVNPRIVKESFTHIEPFADRAATYFYARLFAENPHLRTLFPPAMDAQRDRLFQAIAKLVWSLDSPGTLETHLAQLGRAHRKYGVLPEHYPAMGRAFIATMRRFSGETWTGETEREWAAAFTLAATTMIQAAEQDSAPPWWVGEVIEHDRRTPDIAVIGVRPGQRLPFEAGQYVSVQVSRWPRIWRPFSIANAPREDGVLRFHVRAVPAGWVSGSLVRHTRIGDTVLLGPPLGSMALDPQSDRDLLLVAGGTGLAPLKALVEALVGQRPRNVHLLLGARTARDLYDLPDLRALERAHPWLRVIPVVSQDPAYDGMHGQVHEVLDRFQGWADHDVYLCGPPAMVDQCAGALQALGVPASRLHHDPVAMS